MSEYKIFLDSVFGAKPDDTFILLWTLHDKCSSFFSDLAKAEAFIKSANQRRHDIYIGAGLTPGARGRFKRCKADDIAGICGFWIDLDIHGPSHKNEALPKNEEEAETLIKGHGWDPTLIVHSGHGLHAWWLFKEPWIFETPEERARAAVLAQRFNRTIQERGKEQGWGVDSVFDLARVLRPPGTWNCKNGNPVQATLLEHRDELRYNPGDLEGFFVELGPNDGIARQCGLPMATGGRQPDPQTGCPGPGPGPVSEETEGGAGLADEEGGAQGGGGLVFDPNAEAPMDRLATIFISEPRMLAAWDGQRPDLPNNEHGLPGQEYDLALATYGVRWGLTDQEIVDTLIEFRRKTGSRPQKALRPDYIHKTLTLARNSKPPMRNAQWAKAYARIETHIGAKVIRIVQWTGDRAGYMIQTDKGDIQFKRGRDLQRQSDFLEIVMPITKTVIPTLGKEEWNEFWKTIVVYSEPEEPDEEMWDRNCVKSSLAEYISRRNLIDGDSPMQENSRHPFKRGGTVYVYPRNFCVYATTVGMMSISHKEIRQHMFSLGCRRVDLNLYIENGVNDSKRVQRSVYRVPNKIYMHEGDGDGPQNDKSDPGEND